MRLSVRSLIPRCDERTTPTRLLALLSLLYIFAIALTYGDYGVNPDEGHHIANGKAVIGWYRSGFQDRTSFTWTNIWMYGGAYDVVVHVISGWSPLSVYETRHVCNAIVGLAGIVGVYCLGRILDTRWTGLLAAVFLVLTPRYYGHSFFNHKDIPFAVGYVWSIYTTIRFLEALPRPTLRSMLACTVAIGLTLGIRVGGFILVGYLGLGALVWIWVRFRSNLLSMSEGLGVAARVLAVTTLAYVMMLSAWPWAQLDVFVRPFKARLATSPLSIMPSRRSSRVGTSRVRRSRGTMHPSGCLSRCRNF